MRCAAVWWLRGLARLLILLQVALNPLLDFIGDHRPGAPARLGDRKLSPSAVLAHCVAGDPQLPSYGPLRQALNCKQVSDTLALTTQLRSFLVHFYRVQNSYASFLLRNARVMTYVPATRGTPSLTQGKCAAVAI